MKEEIEQNRGKNKGKASKAQHDIEGIKEN